MYQPVSYRLNGRMGSRDELRTLISTCRKAGVRVYADAVIKYPNRSASNPGRAGWCRTHGADCVLCLRLRLSS
jgi:alpha-amylase